MIKGQDWHNIFQYKDGKLYWRVSPHPRIKVGDSVGSVGADGYVTGSYSGKRSKVHRIIWEMHNGPIPEGYEIDHINHIRTDNHIQNLRIVSRLENARNKALQKNNSTGYPGIYWIKHISRYHVQIYVKGRKVYIGRFKELADAIKAKKEAHKRYGFHNNHGEKNENTVC